MAVHFGNNFIVNIILIALLVLPKIWCQGLPCTQNISTDVAYQLEAGNYNFCVTTALDGSLFLNTAAQLGEVYFSLQTGSDQCDGCASNPDLGLCICELSGGNVSFGHIHAGNEYALSLGANTPFSFILSFIPDKDLVIQFPLSGTVGPWQIDQAYNFPVPWSYYCRVSPSAYTGLVLQQSRSETGSGFAQLYVRENSWPIVASGSFDQTCSSQTSSACSVPGFASSEVYVVIIGAGTGLSIFSLSLTTANSGTGTATGGTDSHPVTIMGNPQWIGIVCGAAFGSVVIGFILGFLASRKFGNLAASGEQTRLIQ